MTPEHPAHLWYVTAAGIVRCARQDCDAVPTEMQAAEAVAEAELAASMRVELDYRTREAPVRRPAA